MSFLCCTCGCDLIGIDSIAIKEKCAPDRWECRECWSNRTEEDKIECLNKARKLFTPEEDNDGNN